MDDPEAEQPLGFRRASAGANLPSGVQAVGMEVHLPHTLICMMPSLSTGRLLHGICVTLQRAIVTG